MSVGGAATTVLSGLQLRRQPTRLGSVGAKGGTRGTSGWAGQTDTNIGDGAIQTN